MVEDLVNPTALQAALARRGIRLSRNLGQNFLVDANVRERIIDSAELSASDSVLEIGGGAGILTHRLVATAGRVTVIETDDRMLEMLAPLIESAADAELVAGDAMRLDLADICKRRGVNKLVSNLPYNVAAPLIVRILEDVPEIRLLVCMVQKEAAERLTAGPGDSDYSSLTVTVQTLARVETVRQVGRNVFFPKPRVDSAVIRLEPLPRPADYRQLKELIRVSFAHRRKMLANNLVEAYDIDRPAVEAALQGLGLDVKVRAQDVAVATFAELSGMIRR